MEDLLAVEQRIEWRRAGLIGAFAGALSGGLWAAMAGAALGTVGVIRHGGTALQLEGWLYLGWVIVWLALTALFLFLGVPTGAIAGGLGGLVWRGRPGPYPAVVAAAVGAGVGGVLWLTGVDLSAGRANVPLGPLPGLAAGMVAGWLFVRLARRSAAGHPIGAPTVTMSRHVLCSELAGFMGVFVGVLVVVVVTAVAAVLGAEGSWFGLAFVLKACFLAALPGTVLGALYGLLWPRRPSRPSRRLLAACALAAGFYCATVVRLSDRLIVPLALTGLATGLTAGLYTARIVLGRRGAG